MSIIPNVHGDSMRLHSGAVLSISAIDSGPKDSSLDSKHTKADVVIVVSDLWQTGIGMVLLSSVISHIVVGSCYV